MFNEIYTHVFHKYYIQVYAMTLMRAPATTHMVRIAHMCTRYGCIACLVHSPWCRFQA